MRRRLILTLPRDRTFARSVARLLKTPLMQAELAVFSAGEHQLVCPVERAKEYMIAANVWEDPSSLFHVLSLAEVVRQQAADSRLILLAPWIAYGRQDRMAKLGEAPNGVLIGRLLSQAFDRIYTFDAHSERFVQAFQGRLVNVYADPMPFKKLARADVVVAPDKGAQARASIVAKVMHKPCLFIDKKREGTHVTCCLSTKMNLHGMTALIVDDMADSGGTLITAATVLKECGAKQVHAFIPHAINLSKLKERSKGVLTHFETAFDHQGSIDKNHMILLIDAYTRDQSKT